MKIFYTIIILFSAMNAITMNAQKLIPLIGYRSNALWLTEKAEKYELSNGNGEILVPGRYNFVLPSVLSDFSFIMSENKIGVYDHISQKEVIFLEGFNEVQLYPGKNNEYYIYFLDKKPNYSSLKRIYQVTRTDGNHLNVIEPNQVNLAVPPDGFYQNGIELIDSMHIVHHHTRISWYKDYGREDGEEAIKYRFQDTLQMSGIFSRIKKGFVISPSYALIEVPMPENIENSIKSSYIEVIQVEGSNRFDFDGAVANPLDTYRYGLYNPSYNMILPPQKNELWKALNYGFYTSQLSHTGLTSLSIYDDMGSLIFNLQGALDFANSIIVLKDHIYVGTFSRDEVEMEMQVLNYKIYRRNGQLIKTQKLRFEQFVERKRIAKVALATAGYELLYGLYDLENAAYVVPADYLYISRLNFKDQNLKCPPNIPCDYYYECISIDDDVFYDSNFKSFKF